MTMTFLQKMLKYKKRSYFNAYAAGEIYNWNTLRRQVDTTPYLDTHISSYKYRKCTNTEGRWFAPPEIGLICV